MRFSRIFAKIILNKVIMKILSTIIMLAVIALFETTACNNQPAQETVAFDGLIAEWLKKHNI